MCGFFDGYIVRFGILINKNMNEVYIVTLLQGHKDRNTARTIERNTGKVDPTLFMLF